MEPSETLGQYCWWKKFCTTWDVKNPVHNGMNYLSTGAGFLPSTVTVILQISSLGAQNVRRYTEIYRDVLRLAKKKWLTNAYKCLGQALLACLVVIQLLRLHHVQSTGSVHSQGTDPPSSKRSLPVLGRWRSFLRLGNFPSVFFLPGRNRVSAGDLKISVDLLVTQSDDSPYNVDLYNIFRT